MDITKQYDKARQAVERGNDDYAIQLLQEILFIRPDYLEARKMLRETVRKKYRKAGVKSAGVSAYIKGILPLIKMNIFSLMKKHDQAMIESEKFLVLDPDNKPALTALGQSARHIPKCTETAIWVFQSIVENHPNDTKSLQTLAQLYEQIDDVQKASDCYEQILRVRPTDRDVELKLRDLAARKTIKTGWDKVGQRGDFKKVMRDASIMEDRSGEKEVIRTDDDLRRNIERVKKDIENEPDNKLYILQLGDLYRRGKLYDEAKAQYIKAKELDPLDHSIDERLGDLKIELFNNEISQLEDTVRKGEAPQGDRERLKELTAQRDAFATEEYKKRVARRPTDLPLRYKLGRLLYEAGEIDASLAEFQHAVKFPQHRRSALTYCGLCLYKKGMYDMAVQMFEDALKGSVTVGPEDKGILYNLGLAAEKLGDLTKAEEAYKRIFNADINYRDVKDKIEAIYKRRQTPQPGDQEKAS